MRRAGLILLTATLVLAGQLVSRTRVYAQDLNQAPPPAPAVPQSPFPKDSRLTPFVVASTLFDSNIDHDTADLDAYGMVVGVGAIVKNNPSRPTFELQYQAGLHRLVNTSRWNRLSHYARASWERRLHRRVAFEAVGEGSLKGSTEDQELSNQAALSPRLEYRFTPALRVRGVGAWRLKRYEDDPDRNALNRYGALELLGRPPSGISWTAGGRYELNATESSRQRYYRWTWYAELSMPLAAHDRLDLQMRYRRQRYPARYVDASDGPDVLRYDVRFEPEVYWLHSIDRDLELRAGYAFSGRNSNDPRRDYRSHQLIFSVLQRW